MVLEFVFPCVVLTEFTSFLHVKPEPSAKDFVFKKSFKIFFFSCVELRKRNFRRIFFHFHFSRKMFQKKTLFFQERFFNVWNWVRKKKWGENFSVKPAAAPGKKSIQNFLGSRDFQITRRYDSSIEFFSICEIL